MKLSPRILLALFACLLLSGCTGAQLGERPALPDGVPDLTQGEGPSVADAKDTWFLHCGRTKGWAFVDKNGSRDTTRQILVTRVTNDDPARRDLKVGDVILGVNGKYFSRDPIFEFRESSIPANKAQSFLDVILWRKGWDKERVVRVDLSFKMIDLTIGEQPGETRDWTLGPIGVNGWGYSEAVGDGGSNKARQLLITLVDEDGPAVGKLEIGDVIIGTNGREFTWDARRALAAAINEAEKEENKGALKLYVWRTGEKLAVDIALPVLGTHSDTAPFNCSKTEKIIDNAVKYMKEHEEELLKPSDKGWLCYINALGLMSTGREDVMPMVRKLAHASLLKPGEKLSVEKHVSMMCWWWSYKLLFLSEYHLLTGDKKVLPTIHELATAVAMGQSGAGTWGHTYAAKENTGYLHGHLGGYGAINQQGLTLMVALPLAKKCGAQHKEVLDAIERGNKFFRYFIGKGTIPYGDHGPAPWYDDNGKSGSAAVYFDLMGNRQGTEFFSEMILPSTPSGRENGHTGHFWSHLWGGLGAARGGDKALQVFMKEMNPIFTLERQHNGRFAFQGNIGQKGDKGKPKAKWDCTGARLLQLCIPRRVLYITGKETPQETQLTQERIDRLLRAGRLEISKEARAKLSLPEILALLKDPLPPTRTMAAMTLAERNINGVDKLIEMLDSTDPYARYGAAEALGKAGFASQKAAERLIDMMDKDDDVLFRNYAVDALINRDRKMGLLSVAKPAIPVLLKMAVERLEDDPRRVLQQCIARALFYKGTAQPRVGLLHEYGLEGVDRSLLTAAIRDILTNENGGARSSVSWVCAKLTAEEIEPLWADIYRASRHIAPSGIMFAPPIRTRSLKLMGKHHIEEGMFLAAWYIRWQKAHGAPGRVPAALAALEEYGAQARVMIPYLQEHVEYWKSKRKKGQPVGPDDTANKILATIEKIKGSEYKPELVSIAKDLDEDDVPPRDGP